MARLGQQLAVFVLSHFFPSFLDDATQLTTSFLNRDANVINYHGG
jgi:hypothetical protein